MNKLDTISVFIFFLLFVEVECDLCEPVLVQAARNLLEPWDAIWKCNQHTQRGSNQENPNILFLNFDIYVSMF